MSFLHSETFAPLRHSVFRMLWLAWLAANLTMWMNDVAAAWLMAQLTNNATLVALVQAASTLPVFLLGLPSGALADIVDRRRYLAVTQLWIASVALVLAVSSVAGWLNAWSLLALTFANGIGLAMRWPVFAAIVPEVVSRQHLPAALALNAISMNASRVVGPIVAGALLAGAGSAAVFALNALLSATAFIIILRWRHTPQASSLPAERLLGAMRVGLQFVRQTPALRALLVRTVLFFVQCTALIALLPLLARRFGTGASTFTLLLAAMGVGAVAAGVVVPALRRRWSAQRVTAIGITLYAGASVAMGVAPSLWVAVPAMVAAGMGWLSTANTLMVSAQLVLPNWVRARGMAVMQVATMGGTAGGALLWGQVATWSSVPVAVAASALVAPVLLGVMARWAVRVPGDEEVQPSPPRATPTAAFDVDPLAGPVMVTVEYNIEPERASDFIAVMEATRQARLRLGTLQWNLLRDSADPTRYVECFVDENWAEHLRRLQRFTVADAQLRDQRLSFHTAAEPPVIRRLIGAGAAHG
ncbi:MFS transporter [uncultured Azohydromonas sp.]|uniref:MFS transporter n=1 Tax=uncultured Azohydromonas sp. TaxID=487342 RepID=UPI0026102F36|nr:MFS transporter [uncultured Azohydromonas sp.]